MMRPDFDTGLKRLQSTFGKELTEEEVDAYWFVLQDVPLEDFHMGIRDVMASDRQYMPRPGQIRSACGIGMRAPRSWAQNAAGSCPGDPDRPARIGRNLADAELCGDEERIGYYAAMIQEMDPRDRANAESAYRDDPRDARGQAEAGRGAR